MPLEGTHKPGTWDYSNTQVQRYESSGGTKAISAAGKPVVVLWTRGRRSGAIRKTPVMRVKDGDSYAAVASKGGSSAHPEWYLNLVDDPHVTLQDGPAIGEYVARTATTDERAEWWPKATDAYPPYDSYQAKTKREIPLVILEPA